MLVRRHLDQEPHPQPLTWKAAAAQPAELVRSTTLRPGDADVLDL